MKILWVTNLILPEASKILSMPISPYGGWLVKMSELISTKSNIELYIASPKENIKDYSIFEGKSSKYIIFNKIERNSKGNKLMIKSLIENIKPDLIHLHGTEYLHSLIFSEVAREKGIKTVVSIQGLMGVYCKTL